MNICGEREREGKPAAKNSKSQADMGGGSITPPASVFSLVIPLRGVRQQQTVTLDTQAPIPIQPNPETEKEERGRRKKPEGNLHVSKESSRLGGQSGIQSALGSEHRIEVEAASGSPARSKAKRSVA
jgi:hypothetical protein